MAGKVIKEQRSVVNKWPNSDGDPLLFSVQ